MQLAGVLILLLGVIVRVGGEIYGTALIALGIVMYATGRVAAWLKSDQA